MSGPGTTRTGTLPHARPGDAPAGTAAPATAAASAASAAPATAAADAVTAADLPWAEELRGRTIVVKFGGNAMVDPALHRTFAQDVVELWHAGLRPVVVHGGGPQISAMLDRLDLEVRFVVDSRPGLAPGPGAAAQPPTT
ncbi:hypothetical protein ABZ054_37560, partial [Streptomyces sp. NPDC006324]